ncbi:MAG: hypothetical protein K8R48_09920 [Alphaproteobacteria bacterium]|nr:hypothetical protein [Alphaproteobacteria bacterium]
MQKKSFGEKLKKFWRGLVREFTGESNRIVLPMTMTHTPMAPMTSASVPNPNNKLEFENSKVTIEGSFRDVHRVRCLDNMIGRLSRSYNEKAQKKIDLHIADVADSLKRVSAYTLGVAAETAHIPAEYLEYSKDGQPIAKIKLGL